MTINLGSIEKIPLGEGREYEVGSQLIAVFRERITGKLTAVQALCPHRQGHLADGFTGNGLVVCPMHAFKFTLADGAAVGHDCGALKTYPVRLNDAGELLIDLAA
jgi:nitrite reductase (NADH) small subunit